jgi:hypothetical protein
LFGTWWSAKFLLASAPGGVLNAASR